MNFLLNSEQSSQLAETLIPVTAVADWLRSRKRAAAQKKAGTPRS